MQVEAIYRHGRLELLQPLCLKRDNVRVLVEVPSEDIDTNGVSANLWNLSPEVLAVADEMRRKLDAVRNAPRPADSALAESSAKSLEREAAFAMREDH